MITFSKIKNLILSSLLVGWVFFAVLFSVSEFGSNFRKYAFLYGLTLKEKQNLIDGDFYNFMQFCQEQIPQTENVIFYNSLKGYNKCYQPTMTKLLFERDKQKSGYYLYPRKVYTEHSKELIDKIDFIIIYNADVNFENFKTFVKYTDDKYILFRY